MVLNIRASLNPITLQTPITAAIRSVNKNQAISDVRSVDQIRDQAMGGRRLVSVLLGTFATVALVLAGIGIYGVISYNVAQRTREMGIRAALGATERSLLRLILDRGVRLTLDRARHRRRRGDRPDPIDGDAPVRCRRARPGDDGVGGSDPGRRGDRGVVRACTPGHASRPGRRPTLRVAREHAVRVRQVGARGRHARPRARRPSIPSPPRSVRQPQVRLC